MAYLMSGTKWALCTLVTDSGSTVVAYGVARGVFLIDSVRKEMWVWCFLFKGEGLVCVSVIGLSDVESNP